MTDLYNNILFFLLYAVVAAGLYWTVPRKYRNMVLLCENTVFYSLCAGWYGVFVLAAGVWSYFCAIEIDKKREHKQRRKRLICGISPLILMLCTFKYWAPASSLLGGILNGVGGHNILRVVLPLGMSYYILKSISYLIDVYRKRIGHEVNVIAFLAYVSFYGQIVSGPIQRYEQWKTEMTKEKPTRNWQNGFYLILLGLFMKLVIANRLTRFVDVTVQSPESATGLQLWLCFFLYAVYIYCDFAGYSYIAIGVTNFHGLDCIDNFNRPYFSNNIREFWNRWHISLSSWLKDYVYIPLGGNRRGQLRRVINVMITFITCGIWHGSSLSFIIWGGYHGVANVLTKKQRGGGKLVKSLRVVWTFVVACAGWVFFATPTLKDALSFFKGMFSRLSLNMSVIQESLLPFTNNNQCLGYFLTVMLFIFILGAKEANDVYRFFPKTKANSFIWQVFLLSSVLLFGVFGASSFIYAGF